ncbi:hypothetical protein HK096_003347 [Nowakowskiella sp. JEL0078]|nr:hypothetical protein HK096_003347 [Nowakowskiella sp. JEL0078]
MAAQVVVSKLLNLDHPTLFSPETYHGTQQKTFYGRYLVNTVQSQVYDCLLIGTLEN